MKIILLSSRFFPHIGGVEKVIAELANNLSKQNEVIVVSSLDTFNGNFFKVEETISNHEKYKLKRIWMNVPRSLIGWVSFPYRVVMGSFSLIRFLKLEKPDVINFHFLDDVSFYIWFSRFFYKTPLIVNVHGNDLHVFSNKSIYRFFISRLLSESDRIVVNSQYMMNDLLNLFNLAKSKVSIIPNGIDFEYIKKLNSKRYIENEYIFFVGRFVHKKGLDVLINAFNEIKNKKIKLVIEGKGEERDNITKLIDDLDLSDRVILSGGKFSEEEKFMYMKGALIGVMPSRVEPFGIVALEYLSCQTPLIASKTGGLIDLLKDKENCLFFNNEDIEDLKTKIENLIRDKELREELSKNGLNLAANYTWDKVSDKYLKLYEHCCNK